MEKDFREGAKRLARSTKRLSASIPETMAAFGQLHKAALANGALSTKHKELIALAIGISSRCEGCISYHVNGALRAGASREEVTETIGVAVLMGGGPSTVYGAEAFEALEQFEAVVG